MTRGDSSIPHARRLGRTHAAPRIAGFAGAATAFVVVLLLSPLAGAGATKVVLTPPYAHAAKWITYNVQSFGCGAAKERIPTFSLKTGAGTFSASSAVPARCPGPGSTESAGGTLGLEMRLGNLSGTRTIYVNWTVRATGFENLSLARCIEKKPPASISPVWITGCSQFAEVAVQGYSVIFDSHSSQNVLPKSSWAGVLNVTYVSNTTICYPSGCTPYNSASASRSNQSFSITTVATWVFSATFLRSHTYSLQTELGGFAEVSESTQNAHFSAPVWGSTSLNMASGGNGATLTSVTIV